MNITCTLPEDTSHLYYSQLETSTGLLTILFTTAGIYRSYFADSGGAPKDHIFVENFEIENLILSGTEFQTKVWQAALQIPTGKTLTYQELANQIGAPKSFRAVANALGQNKIAYLIPCHRVIRTDGSLGGYRWGIERKKKLLAAEMAQYSL